MAVRPMLDPLACLDEDYHRAVIRLTWAEDRASRECILLGAGVELVPSEVPPPGTSAERSSTLSRRFRLTARDVVVSAAVGLEWFSAVARGVALWPDADGKFDIPPGVESPRFLDSAVDTEPPAPSLIAATTDVPFVASWHGTPRVRHLIARASPVARFRPEEIESAAEWLRGELHVNLSDFPEYWGSTHLIAPNPVFRSLRVRHQRQADHSELVFAIVPRAKHSLAGLQLLIEEERPTGWGLLASVPLEGPITRIELPDVPESVRERIIDPRRGLIHDGGFGLFGVGFSIVGNLVTTMRRVEGPQQDVYEVPLSGSYGVAVNVEQPSPRVRPSALYGAAGRRLRRANGKAMQRWFRDQEQDGARALRAVIGPVKAEAFLCDPYFGGDDIRRVVLAIANPGVSVQILTSHNHLRRPRTDGSNEGEHLARRLAEWRQQPPVNPVEVRVMPGRHPAIHDRFLWEGERLWMLGSSVNAFGRRGALMVVVPDSEPVLDDLRRVWGECDSLEQWLAQRTGATEAS